ncbi:hypothetical protein V2J09_016830 [Rumex salicifolius]
MTVSHAKSTASKRKRSTAKPTAPAAEVFVDLPSPGLGNRRAKLSLKSKDEVGGDMEDLFRFKGEKEIAEIRANLLHWYDRNRRVLPWRTPVGSIGGNGDGEEEDEDEERRAYGVWVSEVMLQQTRVATVIDYYNRWMKRWPSIHHLSLASIEEVNEMWAGLGYYRRARYLLEGAKKVTEEGGRFPRTVSTLRKIPGIGDYTAGAIASIAFNEAVPVVDGNVVRVLARIKAISDNPKDKLVVKGKLAEQLVDRCRPGDFNQALMELGATLCTPTSPSCSACPISGHCQANSLFQLCSSSVVTNYPQKVIKTKQRHEFSVVCVLEISNPLDGSVRSSSSNHYYPLLKRPEEGLLAGLWEFPSVLLEEDADAVARRKTIDCLLKKSFNLEPKKTCKVILREDVGEYVHVFSHIRLKMYVEFMIVHLKDGKKQLSDLATNDTLVWKCVDTDGLSNMGLTSGVRKVYRMVQKFKQDNDAFESVPVPRKSNRQTKVGKNVRENMWLLGFVRGVYLFPSGQKKFQRAGIFVLCTDFNSSNWVSNSRSMPSQIDATPLLGKFLGLKLTSKNKIVACSTVQESSAPTESAEPKEAKPVKKSAPAKAKGAEKAPAKPLPELMAEDVIPALKSILEPQEDISELELSFENNTLEGSFVQRGIPYSFWAFFPDGVLTGAKGFSLSSYGSEVSTVEPFLVDEKKITSKHVVFWVEKRLAAQGIIPVWKD